MVNLTKQKSTQARARPKKDSRSRKWLLTLHNIEDTGFDIPQIESIFRAIPSLVYYCIGKERGVESGKIHIHAFFQTRNPVKFSTLRNSKFATADLDIQMAKGTAAENRDYCLKEGKWQNEPKSDQRLDEPSARVEWGELPQSHQGQRTDLEILYDMIIEGLSNAEILRINPRYMKLLSHIDRTRHAIRAAEVKDQWREIYVEYCFGLTNTGKTRHYMETLGYDQTYRITNYKLQSLWDGYDLQEAVIFDEFHSQIPITQMLVYLEGYPNFTLSARYSDKVAVFRKVVIISNIPLEDQYRDIQRESPETWDAFLRRIRRVLHYKSTDEIVEYDSVAKYMKRREDFHPIEGRVPFD